MQFIASEEERALHDAALRAFEGEPGSEPSRQWQAVLDLGVLGVVVPEEAGGLGLHLRHAAAVAEAAGRRLVVGPLLQTMVETPIALLAAAPGSALAAQRAIAGGRSVTIAAVGEGAVQAIRRGDGLLLQGAIEHVPAGSEADHLLVLASMPEGGAEMLLLVKTGDASITIDRRPTADGSEASRINFTDALVPPDGVIATAETARNALARARLALLIARSAELLGIMEAALSATVDYLKTRRQFGRPLADFQAVRHQLADMLSDIEASRAILRRTLSAWDGADGAPERLIWMTYAITARAAKTVCGQAIHLHGAMGMTEDLGIGRFYKRVLVLLAQHGSPESAIGWLARRWAPPASEYSTPHQGEEA